MRVRAAFGIGLGSALTILAVLSATAVRAEPSGVEPLCRAGETDATARPAPASLLPALARAFGLAPEVVANGSAVRCAGGRLLGCIVGANLSCGPANTSRRSAGADAFCHDTPGATDVPMVATGHDTIYEWHCAGPKAVAGRQIVPLDPEGFLRSNWKAIR